MSTVTATDAVAAPLMKGKKKLLILIGAAVLAIALAAGGAVIYVNKRAAAAADAETAGDPADPAPVAAKRDPKSVPTFVPLDPFTVNLADREAERYAQVGVSLELADANTADRIKLFMPVIRNNILMVLAHKTSSELLERDGKVKLAIEIQRETGRALGYEPAADEAAAKGEDQPKKRNRPSAEPTPITAVHFSNFIIQ